MDPLRLIGAPGRHSGAVGMGQPAPVDSIEPFKHEPLLPLARPQDLPALALAAAARSFSIARMSGMR